MPEKDTSFARFAFMCLIYMFPYRAILPNKGTHRYKVQFYSKTMHGPYSVSDFDHCTVIHCDAGEVSLVDQ